MLPGYSSLVLWHFPHLHALISNQLSTFSLIFCSVNSIWHGLLSTLFSQLRKSSILCLHASSLMHAWKLSRCMASVTIGLIFSVPYLSGISSLQCLMSTVSDVLPAFELLHLPQNCY